MGNNFTMADRFALAKGAVVHKIQRFPEWFKKTFLHPSQAMITFYALVVVGLLCYGYTWVNNGFTVPLSGDYSLQEMTFIFNGYDDWHAFFRTGVFPTWDRSVFLGIDNIGGNSFYYLFDPFFLILLIFPRSWLLVLQGLEFIPKMVMAGMFFYWYLGEFGFSPKTRRIGALAFGFNAFSFSYLWFHFIDSVAFLPLVFLGLERIIKKKDPRIFLVGFLLNAMTSYFFFVVFMIGGFFYAVFRYLQTVKERNAKENLSVLGLGFVSFVAAILLGCFTLLPGIFTATNMPRVSSSTSYLDTILQAEGIIGKINAIFDYGTNTHNQVTPLLNFLFLYDDCYSSNLLNVYWYDNYVAGLYVTTPMLLMFFVSFIDSIHQRKWSHILGLAFTAFLVFTPVGFYLFSGFTVGYARYFIVPISWMVVFDCQAIERRRDIPRTYMDLSFVITSILMALSCFLMIYEVNLQSSHFTSATLWDTKMYLIMGSLIWLVLCFALMRLMFHKKHFDKMVFLLAGIDIVVMANLTISFHGLSSVSTDSDIASESKIVEMLKKDENEQDYYRIYNTTATRSNINISLREGYTGLGAFHSVYPSVCQDFIDRSRIPYSYHNWSMGVHNRRYNLETFLGTKYYLVDRVNKDYDGLATPQAYPIRRDSSGTIVWAEDYDIPYGYVDILELTDAQKKELGVNYSSDLLSYLASDECTKSLYVNTCFVDFVFAYDQIIDSLWLRTGWSDSAQTVPYYNLYEDYNEYALLRSAIVENEDYQAFKKNSFLNTGKGTVNYNGHDITIDTLSSDESNNSLDNQKGRYQRSLYTTSAYHEGSSAPIELWQSGTTSVENRMKVTVYSSNWPATESNPSGEYAYCDPDDATDRSCIDNYRLDHEWEYENGIRPGDTEFDYDSLIDSEGNELKKSARKVLYNSKIVITPLDKDGHSTVLLPEADPNDPTTGGYISIFDTDNIEWRLFDKDNHVISFGKHSYSDYKQAHGYYTDRPVAKILGIVKTGSKSSMVDLKKPYVYTQRNTDYQAAIDSLKENGAKITARSDTRVEFSVDYDSDKFLVLNYPKVKGWDLYEVDDKENLNAVTTYSANGGFIGFASAKGKHQYVLIYSSPNFELGGFATMIGMFILIAALFYYARKENKARGFKAAKMTLRYDLQAACDKERWKYVCYEDKR